MGKGRARGKGDEEQPNKRAKTTYEEQMAKVRKVLNKYHGAMSQAGTVEVRRVGSRRLEYAVCVWV